MWQRDSAFSGKMEGSENPTFQGSTGHGCGRSEYPPDGPWNPPSRIDPGEQRPQAQVPGAKSPSCEPPPHAIPAPGETSPGLRSAGWGWWGSADQHTPPSSCPQSWDHWAPRHRRVACSLPRCLRMGGGGGTVTRHPKKAPRHPEERLAHLLFHGPENQVSDPCYP